MNTLSDGLSWQASRLSALRHLAVQVVVAKCDNTGVHAASTVHVRQVRASFPIHKPMSQRSDNLFILLLMVPEHSFRELLNFMIVPCSSVSVKRGPTSVA